MDKKLNALIAGITLVLMLGFAFSAIASSPASQNTTHTNTAPMVTSGQTYVILVHGYNLANYNGGNGNCFTTGTDMYQTLVAHGYITGLVNYYGEFSLKFSNGVTYTDSSYYGTSNTPIQNIGTELGTAMTTLFSGKNVNVDILAYSMGGLVTLYSLENYKVPGVNLQNVIFLASPFDGSPLASVASYLGLPWIIGYQASQMTPGSSFLTSLDNNVNLAVSNYPSTTWIVYDGNYNPWWGYVFFSSSNDGVVSDNSATYLGYNYLYTFGDVHTASLDSFTWSGQSYFQDQSVLNTALNNFGGSY